ncbi:MAG: aldehyde dehydrogenase family protein [Roseovarius sp.]|nr:aldehyde dehydrogenase family protein [Roseovarius sp.]
MTDTELQSTRMAHNIVDGHSRRGREIQPVRSPYNGSVASQVMPADADLVAKAVSVARCGARLMAEMPAFERRQLLLDAADLAEAREGDLSGTLCDETSKTIRDSKTEVGRALDVIRLCADESIRLCGRHVSLDGSAVGHGKMAVSALFPVGAVAGIVPFNAPINLTCHKLAPALAAGNSMIVKAPPQAPKTVELFIRCFLDAGFPAASIGLLHGGTEVGRALAGDPGVDFLSFTGSPAAGLAVKRAAGTRGCILELGGVGPTIVHSDADIDVAAKAIANAGFRLAGQSCASVQNLFVHDAVADAFSERLVALAGALKTGDPRNPETDIGPVIDNRSADRIEARIRKAVENGARILTGGTRSGTLLAPTVLANVAPEMDVVRQEIFGPVVALRRYTDIADPIQWISGTRMGINCGVFTDSVSIIQQVFRQVPTAAVIMNGTSTFRPDQFPYGGTGHSGYGRESPADSVRAMSIERFLVLS